MKEKVNGEWYTETQERESEEETKNFGLFVQTTAALGL